MFTMGPGDASKGTEAIAPPNPNAPLFCTLQMLLDMDTMAPSEVSEYAARLMGD